MSFWGKNFIFDGIPSENFGLVILDFNSSGTEDYSSGAESTIYKDWIYRKPKPYLYGRTNNTPRTITMTVGARDPLTALDRSAINKWLLNRGTYKKLQIAQDDLYPYYWNVIFNSHQIKNVGNIQRGITLTGEADAPWAHGFDKYLRYNFAGNNIQDFRFTFYNDSDDDNYLYPKTTFQLNSIGSSFQIINESDSNRTFLFSGLQANEEIVIDNYYQTVVSSTGLLRLSSFNLQWFRLIPGINNLHLTSGIGTFEMKYNLNKMV